MNEPHPAGLSTGTTASTDNPPTAEQTALLRHFNLLPAEPLTQAEAGTLIGQLEAAPDWQPHLQDWHRDKVQLYPDIFATPPPAAAPPAATPPPQRSFREARWWQSQITDGSLYGYSFRQPSVNQALVILEALDRQVPGWDRENKKRRAHRFMNELATLSPELCKPGCSFPHELPAEDDNSEDAPVPAPAAVRAPSAPFVPSPYAATAAPPAAASPPAWEPPVQPPLQNAVSASVPARKGAGKWVGLLLFLAAGAGAYGYFGFHSAAPTRDDTPAPSVVTTDNQGGTHPQQAKILPPVSAIDSQRRAMQKYPDLAKAGSPLNQTFVAMVHQLGLERSPRLQQPDWPERVADQCASALLIAPSIRTTPTPSPTPAAKPLAAATPLTAPAAATPSVVPVAAVTSMATPLASPASVNAAFISLDASYKEKLNTVRYRQHGTPQEATVQVDLRSMAHDSAKLVVRCVFFKRPNGHTDRRTVLSSSEKHIELAGGEKFSDSFESLPVYRGIGATEEFDGWLVQLFPEGSDKFLKQIGSNGPIEELGKTMKF